MIRAAVITLLSVFVPTNGVVGGLGNQPNPAVDDRAVLELVIDEIWRRASSPILHAGRPPADPIVVVDGARPVCRKKVYEFDPPWPLMCGASRDGIQRILTSWARLPEVESVALVESFAERNQKWQDLPRFESSKVKWLPRQEYIDGAHPINLAVISLPGYSAGGYAVVSATFSCGLLCGTGWYAILEHGNGSWRIVDFISLWIA